MGNFTAWSQTPSTNATADASINWQEGQAKNTINDSARATMAALAQWRDDNYSRITTAGSSNNYTVSLNQTITAYSGGLSFLVVADRTNPSPAPTMTAGGLSTVEWRKAGGTSWAASEIPSGSIHLVSYNASASKFESLWWTSRAFAPSEFATQADSTIIANISGSVAAPSANTITAVLDKIYGTQGGIPYRGASSWTGLAAGTSGQFLKTLGAGANPAWATISEVPSQSGAAGKLLSSDGTTASWSGDSAVRARGTITFSGTTPSLETGSVNCASVSRTGAGTYKVTFTSALASTNYQVIALNYSGALTAGLTTRATTDFTITITNSATQGLQDNTAGQICFVVFGGF